MSLPELSPQMDLYGTEQFLASDFDPADPYRLFSEKVYPLLLAARPTLAQAYCQSNGRPATEPVLMLGVSILQFVYRLPDRQAAEHLKYHLGWKLALHRPLGLESFDPSGLVYFRQRLIGQEKAKLAFDAVLEGLRKAGLIKASHKQRLDSTYVLGLVADLSAAERLRETLRLALQELAEAPAPPQPPFWAELWERYVRGKLDWQLSQDELKARFQQAGQDMQRVLGWLDQQYPAGLKLPQVKLLARVFGENFQVEQQADQAVLTVRVQPPGAVKNPHDPDAQWSRKGKETDWVGYKVQVAETVIDQPLQPGEPTRSFVTAMATQPATGSDEAGMQQVREEQADSGLPLAPTLFVDSAYVSAEVLKQEAEAGRELIGPAQEPANKATGFKSDAFDVNVSARAAVCPAGKASSNCSRLVEQARYRGLTKVRLQNYLIGAACNIKRWMAHEGWEIRQRLASAGAAAAAMSG